MEIIFFSFQNFHVPDFSSPLIRAADRAVVRVFRFDPGFAEKSVLAGKDPGLPNKFGLKGPKHSA
jgi:hypothetical protein